MDKHTSDYTVAAISGYNLQDVIDSLKEEVIWKIKGGWQPAGGIAIACNDGIYVCCQSMVKYG